MRDAGTEHATGGPGSGMNCARDGAKFRPLDCADLGLCRWAVAVAVFAAGVLPGMTAEAVRLMTLDPGHFHAALVQKFMYPQVSPLVHVYAPPGQDLEDHIKRIQAFNTRQEDPTHWNEKVYTNADFLEKMVHDRPGNVAVLAGNNTRKTSYIYKAVDAGLNVLADKPMAINPRDFKLLQKAFDRAEKRKVLLFDIMTERFEITSLLQRQLAGMPEVFGKLQSGTAEEPAVEMESMHYFLKEVDGRPLIRSAWFFDVRQEGEAIPDVGTHLVDLVQWECFPDQALDYKRDIQVSKARRWATKIEPEEFERVTGRREFPVFLKKDVGADGALEVFGNGEVRYVIRGVHARVAALWDFAPAPGAKDSLFAMLRGTQARLVIRQTQKENFQPTLYIEKICAVADEEYQEVLKRAISKLAVTWPGLELRRNGPGWQVVVPPKYSVGHEAHFSQVTSKFLQCLQDGKLPSWEVPCMLAKYYTTTEAFRLSHGR